MARQAENIGLALDWNCLPDPKAVVPIAPIHDSSFGLFAFDRYRPTYREIGAKPYSHSVNEAVYTAVDENKQPTRTINERVHQSVVDRFGRSAQTCSNDGQGVYTVAPYQPKKLASLFSQNVFSGLPIEA